MDEPTALQLILPTDKRNPSFTLYLDEEEEHFHVYYGLELLEVVPNDTEHIAYKLLVGRLYNAGLKVRVLEEVFGVDRKTMRGWGQALRSGDPEQLERALLGREVCRKRTAGIDGYVSHRWPQLQEEGCRNYRQRLQGEIEQIFGVRLSGEALRQMLKEIRGSGGPGEPEAMASPMSEEDRPSVLERPSEEGVPFEGEAEEVVEAASMEEKSCLTEGAAGGPEEPTSNSTPPIWQPEPGQAWWCDHAGLLWFAQALGSVAGAVEAPEPVLAQWLGSVLLGAMNVEQTKYLNWEDLSLLLGSVVRFPTPQREQLKRLANPATVDGVLRWNLRQLGSAVGSDLYLDPHTKHYTGMQSVLKGWCPAIRWADKALHSDFVHSAGGQPIYFECTDNFEDLRARFGPLVQRMRASLGWDAQRVLTLVLDRAIYSAEVFERVIADPALHLITWQKGYQAQPWEPGQLSGSFALERLRNHARDVRLYRFEYVDQRWSSNPALRQIVVRATNPDGVRVQLSILSDDLSRAAEQIVRLMFNRWVQENDFKYLDKHFGINQLTSYRSIEYAELKGQLTDRQVQSHAHRQKTQEERAVISQQARLLVAEERAKRDQAQRQRRVQELEQDPGAGTQAGLAAPLKSELSRLKAASRRYEIYRQQRQNKLDALHEQLQQKQAEKQATQREMSRVDQLIEQGMVRMDTQRKRLMDAIKISARNLFYQALAPFKKAYNNYRDDHDYFRQLTLSAGALRWTGQELEVHILPHVNYSPRLRKIIDSLMQSLNETALVLPDGSGRKLRFRLARKEEIQVRVQLDES